MVEIPAGRYSARLVRHVGRLGNQPNPGSCIRYSLRAGLRHGTTAVSPLCGAGYHDARAACGGGQSLHALQSDPDRPIYGRSSFYSYFLAPAPLGNENDALTRPRLFWGRTEVV